MYRHVLQFILLAAAPVLVASLLYGPEVIDARKSSDRAAQNVRSLEAELETLTAATKSASAPESRIEFERLEGPLQSDIGRAADILAYHDGRLQEAKSMFWLLPLTFFALALLAWAGTLWLTRRFGNDWRSEVSSLAKDELAKLSDYGEAQSGGA